LVEKGFIMWNWYHRSGIFVWWVDWEIVDLTKMMGPVEQGAD
jgi:hypothetical protein